MDHITSQHPADIADQLTQKNSKDRVLSFLLLAGDAKAEVFPYFDSEIQQELILNLGNEATKELFNELAPDDRTLLLTDFPDSIIKEIINLLDQKEREQALNLLGYESDSIARLMTPHYIQAKKDWTVKRVLESIKIYGKKAETLNFVYVVNDKNKLIDDLRIGQLLMAEDTTLIEELMDRNFIAIRTTEKIEESLAIFDKYDREALPIVTEKGILVGIVTFDDLLEQIEQRDTEDMQKFGGMEELDLSYTKTSLTDLVKKRAGWLIVLFLGELLTASAMGHYDEEIAKAVVLALFVPLIISSGGNSGSQAASLIIRAMALKELQLRDWWYVMKKEMISGLLLGGILGLLGFVRIAIWQKTGIYDYGPYWFWVALSVSTSLLLIVLWGTLSGSLIPFLLRKLKLDPATASAPFVATLVDVTGLIIYFSISALFLAGKLL
ncbi:magnesium transporter [Flavobacterium succinicans]|uniref:Magnesium transporter MgtE n=1 Tax=Flavobacterium succinicans TaxID=29536 RepID=A0A199XTI1_9FLAO|nr:magnesium transporter [Flavobacterium succinicans]OAZ05063.1 magnesium transporter MgtE [Flavobacterium succinicans]